MTSTDINLQQLLALQPGLFQRLVQQAAVGDATNSMPAQFTPHTTLPSSSAPAPATSMAAALARLRVNSLMPLNLPVAKSIPDRNSDTFSFYSEYLQSLLNNSSELQQQQPYGNVFDGVIEQQHSQAAEIQTSNRARSNMLSVSDGFLQLSSANTEFNPRLRLKRQNPSSQSLLSTTSNDKSVSFRSEGTPSSSPISISPPFMGGSTSMSVSAPSTALSTASSSSGSAASVDEANDTALLFSAASLPTNVLNVIPSVNNTLNNNIATTNRMYNASQVASGEAVNNEMLVPSNDKEGWCRNKKYIQIVKKGYRCTVCNKVYGRYNSVSYHVTIYHRNPPIRCEEEGCQFTTREARYIHFHKYYRHQIPLPESIDLASRKCPLMRCKHVSKSPAMLEKHMQRHVVDCLRDGIYECAECCAADDKLPSGSFKTMTYEAMYEHLRAMHTIGKMPPMSPTTANPTEIMDDAMDDTARSENEQCVGDSAVNGIKQRNVKSPPNYPCSQCSYRGRTMSNLEHHKLSKHNNNVNFLQSKNEEPLINGEIVSPIAVKSLAPWNDAVMEDLTNFTNINQQQQQQRQQLQRLYELQLLQQKPGFNLMGVNFASLLNNANRHAASGLALNSTSLPNIGASCGGGLGSFGGIGPAGIVDGAASVPSPLNLNLIQQIRSSPENFMRAFEQLLIAQKSLFANLPN